MIALPQPKYEINGMFPRLPDRQRDVRIFWNNFRIEFGDLVCTGMQSARMNKKATILLLMP